MLLDEDFLKTAGLSSLTDTEKKDFIEYVRQEIELRSAIELGNRLSTEKLEEMNELIKTSSVDSMAVQDWIKTNCPDYEGIVETIYSDLKKEILQNVGKLLSPSSS